MKKQISAAISGDLDALLRQWAPPPGLRVERRGDQLHVVFSEDRLAAYGDLKAAVARLQSTINVSLEPFFQASEFTADDLARHDALWLRVALESELDPPGRPPIQEIRCDRCGTLRSELVSTEPLTFKAGRKPTAPIIPADLLTLASRQVVDGLAGAQLNQGLRTVACTITTAGEGDDHSYAWISSVTDLGDPVGEIEFAPPCGTCGRRTIVENRNFLWTFPKSRWQGDICTSSFLGLDTLLVSQRVYQHLLSAASATKSALDFEPIALI